MKKLSKLFLWMVCAFPAVMFFSYYPVITLGSDEAMNFELSLPLIWLVLFDMLGMVMLVCRDGVLGGVRKVFLHWKWMLFPLFLSISCLWSRNMVRGVLTAGVMWAIYLAGYIIYSFRELFDAKFKVWFSRIFVGSSLVMCGILVLQCVLDLCGVSREYTLMCQGCTYQMFGFPHPNGFAIEPQFMGNLLLAPMMAVAHSIVKDDHNSTLRGRGPSRPSSRGSDPSYLGRDLRKPLRILLLVVFLSSLFLTFSRGAIYAGMVGLVFLSAMMVAREKKLRKKMWRKVGALWGVVVIAFLFTLNLQGIMAEVSPTDDTYFSGVSKVINHLSLGVIDIRGVSEDSVEEDVESGELVLEEDDGGSVKVITNSGEKEQAVFDGYVAESTDVRVKLTGVAMETWSRDVSTAMFGVGLGGAGVAMYENELTDSPKEIVQNEYASLLLESGVVGIILFVFSLGLVVRAMFVNKSRSLMFSLMVAFGISLMFFSGLPNALHIYILLALFYNLR